jgi:predicted N-acetyltransferase YhbS
MTTPETNPISIRPLTRADLPAVVAIDAALEGRPRADYIGRRLAAALREPALHVQLAAERGGRLVGYMLGRLLAGEFGRTETSLRLELLGVPVECRGQGVAGALFEAVRSWAARHGALRLQTAADWRDFDMLRWLASQGFELAPRWVLVRDAAPAGDDEAQVSLPAGQGPAAELDFGTAESNDFERGQRGQPEVRPMRAEDLRAIQRIDQAVTGRDRGEYLRARMDEALLDSGVRISRVACLDGAVAGFLMARADLGDFGRSEPVAVLDTLGVDPGQGARGVGRALLREFDASLHALHIERGETVVAVDETELSNFFVHAGFRPGRRLAFERPA